MVIGGFKSHASINDYLWIPQKKLLGLRAIKIEVFGLHLFQMYPLQICTLFLKKIHNKMVVIIHTSTSYH